MRVTLEPQGEHHAHGLYAALQDAATHTHLGSQPPASVDAVRQRIRRQALGPQDRSGAIWLNWIVRVDEEIAGYTQATITRDGTASLAYVLAPRFWGKSIGFAASEQTLRLLRDMPSVRRVIADTERTNRRSQALLERLGFSLVSETGTDLFYEQPRFR